MRHLILTALAFEGIHHPTPVKYLWACLSILSITLKFLLVGYMQLPRSRYSFPGLSIYLPISAATTILQNSPLWGMWGEVTLLLATAVFLVEIVYLSVYWEAERHTRAYDRAVAWSIGLIMLGVMLYVSPQPYSAAYPSALFFVRIYSVVVCFSVTVGTFVYAWSQRIHIPKRSISYGAVSAVWFAVIVWSGAQHTLDRWTVVNIGTAIHIVCLLSWFSTVRGPSVGKSLAGDRLVSPLPHAGPLLSSSPSAPSAARRTLATQNHQVLEQ